jgi:hypothetical protein
VRELIVSNHALGEVNALALVDSDADEPLWNGRPIGNFPATFRTLQERKVWRKFVREPKINAFFEEVLNDAVYGIPMDYPIDGGRRNAACPPRRYCRRRARTKPKRRFCVWLRHEEVVHVMLNKTRMSGAERKL